MILKTTVLLAATFGFLAEGKSEPQSKLCLSIPKMHCNGCVDKISENLEAVQGIKSVSVDLKTKVATLDLGKDFAGEAAARTAVVDSGYEKVSKVACK